MEHGRCDKRSAAGSGSCLHGAERGTERNSPSVEALCGCKELVVVPDRRVVTRVTARPWFDIRMAGSQQAWSDPSSKPKRARGKVVLWSVGMLIVVITAALLVSWWSGRRDEQRLWSLLPHTMGCTSEQVDPMPSPPASVTARKVELEHLGGSRIAVTVTFLAPPPPEPVPVQTAYGEVRNRLGGLHYLVSIDDAQSDASIVVYSPDAGEPWQAVLITTQSLRNLDFEDRPEVPLAASVSGNEVRLVLDLPANAEHLKHQPFAHPITIQSSMSDRSEMVDADSVGIMFKVQECKWSTPVAAQRVVPSASFPPQASVPPARESQSQPAAGFPPLAKPCPQKYGATGAYTRSAAGNDQTSCPFAEEVRISYADMGNPGSVQKIKVMSPTTQQLYDVTCQPTGGLVMCTGGNGAVVFLN